MGGWFDIHLNGHTVLKERWIARGRGVNRALSLFHRNEFMIGAYVVPLVCYTDTGVYEQCIHHLGEAANALREHPCSSGPSIKSGTMSSKGK